MRPRSVVVTLLSCLALLSFAAKPFSARSQTTELSITNNRGLRLEVIENPAPMVRILLPKQSAADRGIEVIFPEHITARQKGKTTAEHLYLSTSIARTFQPKWQRIGNYLQYETDLPPGVHVRARATLQNDGVRFDYYFTNHSGIDYEMIQAVTDPRMQSVFHDARLERTYVHHPNGFDLLASETPERLRMADGTRLPARYLASFLWPIAPSRVEKTADGITYYYKSKRVDEPFIATVSTDGTWVAATFSSEAGNVWSNPELTCQHADPEATLKAGSTAHVAEKILIIRGTLNDALRKVRHQRQALK